MVKVALSPLTKDDHDVEDARRQTAAWLTEEGAEGVDVSYITQGLIDSYERGATEPDEAELAEHGEKDPEDIEAPPQPEGTEDLWVNYGHNLLWMSTCLLWLRVASNGLGTCTSENRRWNRPVGASFTGRYCGPYDGVYQLTKWV